MQGDSSSRKQEADTSNPGLKSREERLKLAHHAGPRRLDVFHHVASFECPVFVCDVKTRVDPLVFLPVVLAVFRGMLVRNPFYFEKV